MVKEGSYIPDLSFSGNYPQEQAALTDYLLIWYPILINIILMAQRKEDDINKGGGTGIIVGVGIGVLVTLIFKKIGIGILMGIIVAFLLRRSFK